MIGLLIYLVVLLVVFGVVFYVINAIAIAEPFRTAILVIIGLIFVLILLGLIGVIPGWRAQPLAMLVDHAPMLDA